eukprot:403339737
MKGLGCNQTTLIQEIIFDIKDACLAIAKLNIIKNVKSVDVSPVAHRNIQRIKNGDIFASTTFNIQGLKSQPQNPIDHANISTASSFMSNNWRGKSDRFTGGFMNFMFQDNSLQSRSSNRLKNSKNIETLKSMRREKSLSIIIISMEVKHFYSKINQTHNLQVVVCEERLLRIKTKADLIIHLQKQVLLRKQIWAAKMIQRLFKNFKMNKFRTIVIQLFRQNKERRLEEEKQRMIKIKAVITIQRFWRGYIIRKKYQPPIKKRVMDKNFQYFESMRRQLLLNAAIIIRYHWIKYKRNKLKRQKKQQVRRQNIIVKARVDTGLGSAMRKMSNNYSSIKKNNSNGLNYSFDPHEYQNQSMVSPMIRQRQFGQELESPSMRSEMQQQMQGFEMQSPMLKLSPYIDKQKQQNQQLILTPQQMLKAQQVSTFANNKSKANLQGFQKAKIGDFDLEGPIIEEVQVQSKIQSNGQQSTIPQGIQRNQSQAQTNKSPLKTQNPKLKIVVPSKASSPTRLPINNKKMPANSSKKSQQQITKLQPIKQPILEEKSIDEEKDNSTGITIIQLNTLANIMEQDDEFTPDNRGNLVQNKLQQNIAIEQALLLQDQINENHLDSHDFEKFANRSNFAAGSLEFDKIEEESYSQVGNDEEDEEENYDDEEIKV